VICRALHNLPESLDETYDRILQSITHGRQEFAQHLFQCLAVSIRPLRVEELADILAIEFEAGATPKYYMDYRVENPEDEVLSICSSLITIVDIEGSRVVRFSHFSVKEYLTSQRLADSGKGISEYHVVSHSAHTVLTQASLSVLLALDDQVNKDSMKNYPLAVYAARYWVDHAQVNNISSGVKDAMERLFNPGEPHFATWVWIHDIDYSFRETMFTEHPSSPTATPLYYATLCGFRDLVEHLIITRPGDINARGGCHDTPLQAAVIKGYVDIIRLLLEHGADMATLNDEDFGPLHEASRRGRLDVIGLLLDHRADVDSRNFLGRTPLFIASQEGELEVARVLLQRGAAVNSFDYNGNRPLTTASKCGHLDVVRLLLQNGATVDQGSLEFASENGHLDVVRLLLQNGATATGVPHCMHRNTLALASKNGHLDVVHLLLQNGTAVDVHCSGGWTSLILASQSGHLDVVRLLLGNGATVDFRQNDGWTSLMFASQNGHVDVVRLLLQRSVSVECCHNDSQISSCGTPPRLFTSSAAVQNDRHADSNPHGGCPGSALHLASTSGHPTIAELLIRHGADVNPQNHNQETPLHLASRHGQLKTTYLLLASARMLILEIARIPPHCTKQLKADISTSSHCYSSQGQISTLATPTMQPH
jgi:ankyrin repeat protein